MNRHLTTHDLTWFLEASRNNQLDLDPPYQRRSVWTRKDRQFFIDTIFRNYPSPAIFLHKSVDENGRPTYHVVDGKQRIQSVLFFVENKLRIAEDYGNVRLNSKRWVDLKGDADLRARFWNYKFVVEELGFESSNVVNDVFERINRNARKLTRQELRHAKYDGWFIKKVEQEAESPAWRTLGIVTQGREKRMADSQFISELMLIALEGKMQGFNQDNLDDAYAEYDDISHEDSTVNEEEFAAKCEKAKSILLDLEGPGNLITKNFKSFAAMYTLWSVIILHPSLPSVTDLSEKISRFSDPDNLINPAAPYYEETQIYVRNLRGASTDLSPRQARYDALVQALGKSFREGA